MTKHSTKFTYTAALLCSLLIAFATLLTCSGAHSARAAASSCSNVLDDLSTDSKFNVADYPVNNGDYSLQLIQLAESTDGELLIYVYQPAITYTLRATSINIADSIDDPDFDNYTLTLLSRSETIFKYIVDDYPIDQQSEERIYNISAIYRGFNSLIDEEPDVGSNSEIAYTVAQRWVVYTVNGSLVYGMEATQVVEITDLYPGFIRYGDLDLAPKFLTKACDSHFVAFNTDLDIDYLIQADIEFTTQNYYKLSESSNNLQYEEKVPNNKVTVDVKDPTVTLTYDPRIDFLFNDIDDPTKAAVAKEYSWERISTVEDFLNDRDIDEETKSDLRQYKWILNFYETAYEVDNGYLGPFLFVPLWNTQNWIDGITQWGTYYPGKCKGTLVTDTTILRLEFSLDGEVYNLGAVSNKVTESSTPTFEYKPPEHEKKSGYNFWTAIKDLFASIGNWFKSTFNKVADFFTGGNWWRLLIVGIVAILIIIPLLAALIPAFGRAVVKILKAIVTAFLWILNKLWWVICLPFRLLAALFRRRKTTAAAKSRPRKARKKSRGKKKK